jgi:hypothetical protein
VSRSYRKPYAPVTLAESAKEDKRIAARAVRRAQNRWVRTLNDEDRDAEPIPHFRECPHNDVWGWSRDGKQRFQSPFDRELTTFHPARQGVVQDKRTNIWPPLWYQKLLRK